MAGVRAPRMGGKQGAFNTPGNAKPPTPSTPPPHSAGLPIASASDDAPWAPRSLGAPHWRPATAAATDDSASASDGGDALGGFIPPHVLAARLQRRSVAGLGSTAPARRRPVSSAAAGASPDGGGLLVGSVCEGAGRKLTGAAAARFRVAVMRQTGFVEAADGGGGSGREGSGTPSSPAGVPVAFDAF